MEAKSSLVSEFSPSNWFWGMVVDVRSWGSERKQQPPPIEAVESSLPVQKELREVVRASAWLSRGQMTGTRPRDMMRQTRFEFAKGWNCGHGSIPPFTTSPSRVRYDTPASTNRSARPQWASSSVSSLLVAASPGRTRRSKPPPMPPSTPKAASSQASSPRTSTPTQTSCYAPHPPSSPSCPPSTTRIFLLSLPFVSTPHTFFISPVSHIYTAHSVNDLLATPPLTPTPSLVTVATTPGLSRSGTYLVKVHGRTTHSRTEFPRANPPSSPTRPRRKQPPTTPEPVEHDPSDDEEEEPEQRPRLKAVNFTPKDTSRLYKLRRDPSVASLLDLYDDQGCLDSHLFANDPPSPALTSPATEGRAPRPRTGSTFRQLLGAEATFALNNTAEGDLSWAERFLE